MKTTVPSSVNGRSSVQKEEKIPGIWIRCQSKKEKEIHF